MIAATRFSRISKFETWELSPLRGNIAVRGRVRWT